MAHKVFHVLALALIIGVIMTNAEPDKECSTALANRIQCRSDEVLSEEECLLENCCYDADTPDAISCFKKAEESDRDRRTTKRRTTTRKRRG